MIEPLPAPVETLQKKLLPKPPSNPINYYVIHRIPDSITEWETELFSDAKELSQSETMFHRPPPVMRMRIPVDLFIECVTAPLLCAS